MAAKKKGRAERRFAPTVSRLLVGLVMFFVMFTLLSAAITPERYDIQIGQPAPNTIKAAKDVEDIITTEKLRNDAANNVRSVYSVDENAKDTVLQTLSGRLDVVEQVANLYLPPEDGKSEVTEAQLSTANQQLAPVEITSDELVALGAAEPPQAASPNTMAAARQRESSVFFIFKYLSFHSCRHSRFLWLSVFRNRFVLSPL